MSSVRSWQVLPSLCLLKFDYTSTRLRSVYVDPYVKGLGRYGVKQFGSIPTASTFNATVAERSNATDCKSVKPRVQITPVAPVLIDCMYSARGCIQSVDKKCCWLCASTGCNFCITIAGSSRHRRSTSCQA